MLLSGIGFVPQIKDVRAVRPEPCGVSFAQLALPQSPAVSVCVSGERGGSRFALARTALGGVAAREQLDFFGHAVL